MQTIEQQLRPLIFQSPYTGSYKVFMMHIPSGEVHSQAGSTVDTYGEACKIFNENK